MAFAILLLFAGVAQVGAAGPGPGAAPRPVTAAPVTLALRLADQRRQFRPGEIIRIELEFASATTGRFTVDGATYDRSGRLTVDEFVFDRIDDVSDPMLDYFASIGGFIGGGIRGIGALGEKPFTVKLELNEWFRFDTPGIYTLAVTSRRVTDESVTPHAVMSIESNPVSFEILPRSAAWEAAELAAARRLVEAQPSVDARAGCRMLRFLGTEEAAMAMVRRYGADSNQGCDFDYMAGLFGAANRPAVVRAMEAGLRVPDQPVTGGYLRTLATLSVYLQHPEFRPAQTRETKGRLAAGGELGRRADLIDAALSAYGDLVAAALPDKTGRARAITLAEAPGWMQRQRSPAPAARNQLAAAFLDLPVERQASLLEHQWRVVKGPAMLPTLRQLVATPPAGATSVRDLALRRLAQLAPDEARPLILREIQKPQRGATLKTLGSLPDAELPNLDDVLAANFEAGSGDEIHAALVERYASRKIAPRILASAGDKIGTMACRQQASILAYFLRVDEATGAMLLDRAMTSRATGCWTSLNQIAELRMTPVVQARAIADLDHPDPEVVIGGVKTLGQHGTAAALEPLRAAFQRWHVTWAGKASELEYSHAVERPHARQSMVEDAFRQAIGAGRNWLARTTELRDLQSLCVTQNCRTQTASMIHEDDTRIMVWDIDEPGGSHIELAQYHFRTMAALKEKMAQYPRGTSLTIQRQAAENEDVTAAIAEIKAFAALQGLSIKAR